MPNQLVYQLTVPIEINGVIQDVTFDIADSEARARLAELGEALYWVGVTTSVLSDGDTTNPIVVNGENVTVRKGGVAQASGTEYAWNGNAWQTLAPGNLGTLAYQNSATGSYTPAGNVSVEQGTDTKTTVNSIVAIGTLPSATYDATEHMLTFHPGTLPTKGADTQVVTASGTRSATFAGTAGTVTVS